MKLYVSSKALFKYKNEIKRLFNNDGNLSIVCELSSKLALYKAHKIIKKELRVYPNYLVNITNFSRKLESV